MRPASAFVAVTLVVLGAGSIVLYEATRDEAAPLGATPSRVFASTEAGAEPGSALEGLERRLQVNDETKAALGEFALRGGRRLRVHAADTADGKSCLLEVEDSHGVAGAMCLEDGLFGSSRAAFSVSSGGGPVRFTDLHVLGVVARGVVAASLSKTDGSTVDLRLNGHHAFLYESTPSDLERDFLPSGIRLFGPRRELVETIDIPSLR